MKKCFGNIEEDCRNKGETSNTGEYNECNLETQLSLADRMSLISVKEWCTVFCTKYFQWLLLKNDSIISKKLQLNLEGFPWKNLQEILVKFELERDLYQLSIIDDTK